jgi:hypothetical protein
LHQYLAGTRWIFGCQLQITISTILLLLIFLLAIKLWSGPWRCTSKSCCICCICSYFMLVILLTSKISIVSHLTNYWFLKISMLIFEKGFWCRNLIADSTMLPRHLDKQLTIACKYFPDWTDTTKLSFPIFCYSVS